ncbi:MAG: hypothetical protein IJ677_01095 [Alphaproteobacteria bacterium]|nr:hypothetical protein [Alphaproteobacteria bacterium]
MAETPVIVISSSEKDVGKTTIGINLSAALWSDRYDIKLFAPANSTVDEFMSKRLLMCSQCKINMPMPQIITSLKENYNDKSIIVAIIPSSENERYSEIFFKAHTLISLVCEKKDLNWSFSHPYINLIWQTKKNAAARGVKQFNWIVVQNKYVNENNYLNEDLQNMSKQFGFRIAEPLHYRNAYKYIENGYCTADMVNYKQIFKMSMDDVYTRREILNLTDDLWKHK